MNYNPKIRLDYYRIDRASEIIGCDVDDIVHMWLSGALKLYADLKGTYCYLTRYQLNSFEECEMELLRVLGGDPYKEKDLSKSLKWFSYMSEDVTKRYIEKIDDICKYIYYGKAYGLWEVSTTIVTRFVSESVFLTSMDNINSEGSTNESCFVVGELFEHDSYRFRDYLSFDDAIKINKIDLVITHADVDSLMSKEWGEIPSFINKLKVDEGNLTEPSGLENNIEIIPHHTAERHATNREQVLMAAMRFKEEQPNVFNDECRKADGSINYSAWARELINRPTFFLNNTLPIKTETKIAEILSNAHKAPEERKN